MQCIEMNSPASDPSALRPFAVCSYTFEARNAVRDCLFLSVIWCPGEPGVCSRILCSYDSRGSRPSAMNVTNGPRESRQSGRDSR